MLIPMMTATSTLLLLIEYGKEFSLPVESASSFNRYGYNFKGWYEYENDKTNEVVTKIEKGSSGDRTFAAKWSAKTYKISFNFNGMDIRQKIMKLIRQLTNMEQLR